MDARVRAWLLRGVTAGVAGALGLAVVLSLVKPPPTQQQRRAVAEANASLADSGVEAVGTPVVTGGSVFDDPGGAIGLAAASVGFGVGVGVVLGLAAGSRRWRGGDGTFLVAFTVIGYAVTIGVLAAVGRFRGRELGAFAVFWIVTAAAAWFSPGRSPAVPVTSPPR